MISKILVDFFSLAIEGTAAVSRRLALLKKTTPEEGISPQTQAMKIYLKSLRRLAVVTILFPLPILALGIIMNSGWLVALVGIFWVLPTFALAIVAAPLGLLLEGLLGGLKGVGERYVKFVFGALLVELSFTLFVAVFPIENNLAALPIIFLAAVILGIVEARGANTIFTRRFIAGKASAILAVFILSLFFPQGFGALRVAREKIDAWIAKTLRSEIISGTTKQTEVGVQPETYTFPDGVDQVEVPLHSTRWSGWVITPPASKWCIYPPDNGWAESSYKDGYRSRRHIPGQNNPVGVRRGVFRLRGEGGNAIVTIERR